MKGSFSKKEDNRNYQDIRYLQFYESSRKLPPTFTITQPGTLKPVIYNTFCERVKSQKISDKEQLHTINQQEPNIVLREANTKAYKGYSLSAKNSHPEKSKRTNYQSTIKYHEVKRTRSVMKFFIISLYTHRILIFLFHPQKKG